MTASRFAFLLIMVTASCGCSTQLNSVFRRPIVENGLEGGARVISVDASRRSIMLDSDDHGRLTQVCAEPPPDVADKITAALEISAKASAKTAVGTDATEGAAEARVMDNYAQDAVKLFERAVVADVFRTAGYTLCQYHLNGAIDGKELARQYEALTTHAFAVLMKEDRAAAAAVASTPAPSAPITVAPKVAPSEQ
jgi:hypothetical protein